MIFNKILHYIWAVSQTTSSISLFPVNKTVVNPNQILGSLLKIILKCLFQILQRGGVVGWFIYFFLFFKNRASEAYPDPNWDFICEPASTRCLCISVWAGQIYTVPIYMNKSKLIVLLTRSLLDVTKYFVHFVRITVYSKSTLIFVTADVM